MRRSPAFSLMIDIVDSASVSQLTLAVETKSPRPTAPIEDTIAAFVVATNTGMFSKTPSAQTTPIIVEASESSAERCEYVWRSTGVQMGAYRVLIGMLDAANQLGAELESVRLVSSADRGARLTTRDLIDPPLTIKAARPPFDTRVRGNLKDFREPLIRLEFSRAITDDELRTLSPLFSAWDSVAIRGGFLDTESTEDRDLDIDAALASPQTYLAAPNTVEHLFDDFIGGEAAFRAVLNMATKIHTAFCPLTSLEIE
jgi:hypothetical protein